MEIEKIGGSIDSESKFMKQNTKVTYSDGDVWIPEGFKIAETSASTVQGGIVIEDSNENQFVWIPVANISDYKRIAYGKNIDTGITETTTNSTQIKQSSQRNSLDEKHKDCSCPNKTLSSIQLHFLPYHIYYILLWFVLLELLFYLH